MANAVAYGFLEYVDLFKDRVTDANTDVVNTAIAATVAEHNRQIDAVMGLFVSKTTRPRLRYTQINGHRLQPLSDDGRARPVKVFGHYDVGFPLQNAGTAYGMNYIASKKATFEDVNNAVNAMTIADNRWMRDHVLGHLFNNVAFDYEDEEIGTITVMPLANGDTTSYQISAGQDTGATDTHQFAQTNPIGAGVDNPFINLYTEIMEHPENQASDVLVLASTSLRPTISALPTFFKAPDANITEGSGTAVLTGQFGRPTPGKMLGYDEASGVWVSEWSGIPAGYMVAVAVGNGNTPLGQREHPEPELQGFNEVADRIDHPYYEKQYLRITGFGALNRVAAAVQRIGAGVYTVPTGYNVPMP